ncbi:unnamed protein product, partial [Adineta steineri]
PREKPVHTNEDKDVFISKLNRVIKQQATAQQQQQQQQPLRSIKKDEGKNYYSIEPVEDTQPLISPLIDDFSNTSLENGNAPILSDKTTDYLDIVRRNPSNSRCADCDCEHPTIAIMSWLLVICKKCAGK